MKVSLTKTLNLMRRDYLLSIVLIILCCIGIVLAFIQPKSSSSSPDAGISVLSKNKILVLNLNGVISEGSTSKSLLPSASSAVTLRDNLIEAKKHKEIKGILIRINSPGGTVGLSQEIYHLIKELRKDKIIIASFGDVSASGGYYIGSACDLIFANAGTLTGSIGVISHNINYSELLDKVGLKDRTFKAGKYKDIGNGARAMTAEEKQIFQAIIDDTYEQFLQDVYEGRYSEKYNRQDITLEHIQKHAQGLIYTGRQAQDVKLIDKIGGYAQALNSLQKLIQKDSKGSITEDLPVIKSLNNNSVLNKYLPFGINNTQDNYLSKLVCLFDSSKCQAINSPENINNTSTFHIPIMLLAPEFVK